MPLAMRDGLVLVVERHDHDDRAEDLLLHDRSCRRCSRRAGWARRRSPVSMSGRSPPATTVPPSAPARGDVALDPVAVHLGDDRARRTVSRSSGSPTFSVPGRLRQPGDQLVVDAARCTSTRVGRGADLAGVEGPRRWRCVPMAVLRSASSNTMPAPLPPSSSSRRFIWEPATARCADRRGSSP